MGCLAQKDGRAAHSVLLLERAFTGQFWLKVIILVEVRVTGFFQKKIDHPWAVRPLPP